MDGSLGQRLNIEGRLRESYRLNFPALLVEALVSHLRRNIVKADRRGMTDLQVQIPLGLEILISSGLTGELFGSQ